MLDIIRRNSQSWMVKAVFGIIIIVFVFWGIQSYNSAPQTVVATVGDQDISTVAYEKLLQETYDEMRRNVPSLTADDMRQMGIGVQVLQAMIVEAQAMGQAKALGLSASPQELRDVIAKFPQFQAPDGKFDQKIYDKLYALDPRPLAELEDSSSRKIVLDKLQNYIGLSVSYTEKETRDLFNFEYEKRRVNYIPFAVADFAAQVEVAPEEAVAYYESNKDKFKVPAGASLEYVTVDVPSLAAAAEAEVPQADVENYYKANMARFTQPERWHARHILIAADGADKMAENPSPQLQDAEKRIKEIEKEIKAGKDFAELAKEYSNDPGSAPDGGDLGFLPKGVLVPPFEKAMTALKPGEVSQIVATPFGFHLIKLLEIAPAGAMPLADVEPEIRRALVQDKVYALYSRIQPEIEDGLIQNKITLENLAKEYNLEIKKTGMQSLDALAAALRLTSPLPDLGKKTPGSMLSDPLPVKDGFIVAKVSEVSPARTLEQKEVADRIEAALKREKADGLALKAAEAALEEARKSGSLGAAQARLVKDVPVRRDGTLTSDLGAVSGLGSDAYAAQKGEWLPKVYLSSNHVIVAQLADISPASDDEWAAVKDKYMQGVVSLGKDIAMRSFIERANAAVEVRVNESNPYLRQVLSGQN